MEEKYRTKINRKSTRLYQTYRSMNKRCYNKNNKAFKWYGEKGIVVCDEWKNNYKAFVDWALANGYSDDLTIDRIDSNMNYCPENCRWVTMSQNIRNAHLGIPKSDEWKRKHQQSMKGKVFSNMKGKVPSNMKSIICKETAREYQSISSASRETGIPLSSISLVLSGRYKTAGGYHWQLA